MPETGCRRPEAGPARRRLGEGGRPEGGGNGKTAKRRNGKKKKRGGMRDFAWAMDWEGTKLPIHWAERWGQKIAQSPAIEARRAKAGERLSTSARLKFAPCIAGDAATWFDEDPWASIVRAISAAKLPCRRSETP